MKLFAKTAFEHVQKQIETHIHQSRFGQKLLCMVPSVPPKAAVDFADLLIVQKQIETHIHQSRFAKTIMYGTQCAS